MARTEDIDSGIWNEADFFDLESDAKLLYIWSWSNTRCHMSGIYQVPAVAISFETKLTAEAVTTALAELAETGFVFHDGRWLWCKARVKRIRTRTVEMCKSVSKDLHNVPESHPYRRQLLDLQGDAVWRSTRGKGEKKFVERTTIREQLVSLSGGSPEGQGYHPSDNAAEPHDASHTSTTTEAQGTGTGKGIGKFPLGRGAGEGFSDAPQPSLGAIKMRDEHFPGEDAATIDVIAWEMRMRREEVTPATIREALATQRSEETAAVA